MGYLNPVICVLGETLEQSIQLLDLLCEANQEDIYRRRRNVGIMNDGTELIAVGIQEPCHVWSRCFDYVFYADNKLPYYCAAYGNAIEYLEKRCLSYSDVPREFQWCTVDTESE